MTHKFARCLVGATLAAGSLALASISLAQAPAPAPQAALLAPGIPPSHVVDLMTAPGASALGAQWRVSDVKIVEVPAIQGAMPQYKSTYNIEPQDRKSTRLNSS